MDNQSKKEEQARQIIFEILTEYFFMTQEEDFLCKTSINHSEVDFLITKEAIGIRVSLSQPSNEIKTFHIHNAMIITFPCGDFESMTELIVRELKRLRVAIRANNKPETDSGEW